MEDDQNGRRPKWKTTKMEAEQNGRLNILSQPNQPELNILSKPNQLQLNILLQPNQPELDILSQPKLEDDHNGRWPKWKTTKMEDDQKQRRQKNEEVLIYVLSNINKIP